MKNNIRFNFYIDNKISNKSLVLLFVRKSSETVKFSTSIYIKVDDWDVRKQLVKHTHPNFNLLNSRLLIFLNNIQLDAVNYFEKNPKSNLKNFKKYIGSGKGITEAIKDKDVKKTKPISVKIKEHKPKFHMVFEEYLQYLKSRKSIGIYKKINTVYNKLKSYENKYRMRLDFDKIDLQFYDRFNAYLLSLNTLSNNTINKYIDGVKMYMNWSYRRGFHTEQKYQLTNKLGRFENEIIHLTEVELKRIENLDLTEDKPLQKYRDLFLFGCYTGQRFSDLNTVQLKEVYNHIWIKNQQKSTGKTNVRIPLSPKAMALLNSYPDGFKIKHAQVYNRNIKEICKLAGIDTPTLKFVMKGNKKFEDWRPKYEYITSHTARKTFITLSLSRGMSVEAIKKISGHTTDKEFRKYLRVQDSWVIDEFNKSWSD